MTISPRLQQASLVGRHAALLVPVIVVGPTITV